MVNKDEIKEYLQNNPDVLREALKNVGVKTGQQAYTLIKKEVGTYDTHELKGTKIVKGKPKKTVFYTFRLPNESIVRIPEHCLDDYNIKLDKIPTFIDEGEDNDRDK